MTLPSCADVALRCDDAQQTVDFYRGILGLEIYQSAVGGTVDIVAGTSFLEIVKAGKLRPLAGSYSPLARKYQN